MKLTDFKIEVVVVETATNSGTIHLEFLRVLYLVPYHSALVKLYFRGNAVCGFTLMQMTLRFTSIDSWKP